MNVAGCAEKRNGDIEKDGTLACLRAISPHDLQKRLHEEKASKGSKSFIVPYPEVKSERRPVYMWGPVIDGSFIQDYPYALLDANKFVKVPVIFGLVNNPYLLGLRMSASLTWR